MSPGLRSSLFLGCHIQSQAPALRKLSEQYIFIRQAMTDAEGICRMITEETHLIRHRRSIQRREANLHNHTFKREFRSGVLIVSMFPLWSQSRTDRSTANRNIDALALPCIRIRTNHQGNTFHHRIKETHNHLTVLAEETAGGPVVNHPISSCWTRYSNIIPSRRWMRNLFWSIYTLTLR